MLQNQTNLKKNVHINSANDIQKKKYPQKMAQNLQKEKSLFAGN